MAAVMIEEMNELTLDHLESVVGGNYADDAFLQYANYLESLYEKYHLVGGLHHLKEICTADDKAQIRKMWKQYLRAYDYELSHQNQQ